jgi:hypothetical protein
VAAGSLSSSQPRVWEKKQLSATHENITKYREI